MKSEASARDYKIQLKEMAKGLGLSDEYGVRIVVCSTMTEVFEVLNDPDLRHIALLSSESGPINQSFAYIKNCLAQRKSVTLALFCLERGETEIH